MTRSQRYKRWILAWLLRLAFIAVALSFLAAGLWFGAVLVNGAVEVVRSASEGAEGRRWRYIADALQTAGPSFRFLPTAAAGLFAIRQGLPKILGKVIDDFKAVFEECKRFVDRTHSWSSKSDKQDGSDGRTGPDGQGAQRRAGLIPAARRGCFSLFAAAALVGSFGAAPPPPPADPPLPATYVVSAGPALHLLPAVHFQNAEIDAAGALTGPGTTLDDARRTTLETVVRSLLLPCRDRQVTITPYGFASDDNFRGVSKEESDRLNTEAANRRASAVYAALQQFSGDIGGLTIEPPAKWAGFEEMKTRRDSMVRVPAAGKLRASRSVMLHLTSADACRLPEGVS